MARASQLGNLPASAPLWQAAAHILTTRLSDVQAFVEHIPHSDHVEELHDLRIAVKRLRYTLELTQTLFAQSNVHPLLNDVQALQELVGALHDDDVLLDLLAAQAAAASYEESADNAAHILLAARAGAATLLPDSTTAHQRTEAILRLLVRVSAQRQTHYADLVTWWAGHTSMMPRLYELVATLSDYADGAAGGPVIKS